jgi:hypothetical protein
MTDPTVPQPEQPVTPPPPAYQPPVYQAPGYQAPGYQAPGYQQPGYAETGYATAGYAPAGPRTNTLAIVALILGIVVPIGGIITGHIALSQIQKSGEAGHGLALAGTIIGYALSAGWIIFWVVWIIFYVVLLGTAGAAGAFDPSSY